MRRRFFPSESVIALTNAEVASQRRVRHREIGTRFSGGHTFSRGALYALLSIPIDVGEIRHKNLRHPGQHQAIVDRTEWERTQRQLQEHPIRTKSHDASLERSPLTGRLVDENGDGLTPSYARKRERKYRYYVSRDVPSQGLASSRVGWRLPARELENRVAAAISGKCSMTGLLFLKAAQRTTHDAGRIERVLHAARTWSRLLQSEASYCQMLWIGRS